MKTQNSVNATNARKGGCCCANKPSTAPGTQNFSEHIGGVGPQFQLQVKGATCGGCVKSIEKILRSVTGVTAARMDLASGIASVAGTVQSNELLAALELKGYPATVVN